MGGTETIAQGERADARIRPRPLRREGGPIIDLVELTQSFVSVAFAPNTAATARDSSTSPMGVDVPCAFK